MAMPRRVGLGEASPRDLAMPVKEPVKKRIKWFENGNYYSAAASLLDVLPVVAYKQLPYLLGRWPYEREMVTLEAGLAEVVKAQDARWQWRVDVLRRRDIGPRRIWKFRPVGFYQSFCWNPRLAPGVLAACADPGDWLLLGRDVGGWFRAMDDDAEAVPHWSYDHGGIGAGFLVTHLGGATQRWTFFLDRAGRGSKRGGAMTIYDLGHGLVQEIGALVTQARAGGLLPELRFLWTTQHGELRSLSTVQWGEKFSEFTRAFDDAARYGGFHGGMMIEGGRVRVSHGVVYGVTSPGDFQVALWNLAGGRRWLQKSLKTGNLLNVEGRKS